MASPDDAGGAVEDPKNGILCGGEPVSYWFDACEDDAMCGIDFSDFDSSIVPGSVVDFSDQTAEEGNFFKEFDRILESFNEALLHRPPVEVGAPGAAVASVDAVKGDGLLGPPPNRFENNSRAREFVHECAVTNVRCDVSDKKRASDGLEKGRRGYCEDVGRRDDMGDGGTRCSKRARTNGITEDNDAALLYGRYEHPRHENSKRRVRDWDECDHGRRRDIDQGRKREIEDGDWRDRRDRCRRHSRDRDGRDNRDRDARSSREKNVKERDGKGFWERDRTGKLVFRVGSWENREEKKSKQEGLERVKKDDKLLEEREKPAEEQARKYQLDVLEQAKKKNTIAFLETGAGKTLIAVLLIKSINHQMQKKKMKMLAIFLVPKVPLVYQVNTSSVVVFSEPSCWSASLILLFLQQAEVIRDGTGYNVGHYCGEMGQDFWDARRWQREFETKQARL